MTTLLSAPKTPSAPTSQPVRRPLWVSATFGGVGAAAVVLSLCLVLALVGWFAADAGAHGSPRDALRVGALGWLFGHGSGLRVDGTPVTMVPLGLTALCVWALWRIGLRVGNAVSGHGPDADAIADGERDWTVPGAVTLFTCGYLLVTILTGVLAATSSTDPSLFRAGLWSVALCLAFAAPGIAVGSGRAAIWATMLPGAVRGAAAACLVVLLGFVSLAAATGLVALLLDLSSAANVFSQLHTSGGETAVFAALTLLMLPNAVIFSGAYLLGPGFTVGTGTLVSPTLVSLGPVPAFPLLAALPDSGPTPWYAPALMAGPVLVAAIAVALNQQRHPTLRWDVGALQGCVGGVLAGVVFGLLAWLAGGSAGPGRMHDVSPFAFQVMLHGVVSFGLGGLVGGLAMTFWQRRTARRETEPAEPDEA